MIIKKIRVKIKIKNKLEAIKFFQLEGLIEKITQSKKKKE